MKTTFRLLLITTVLLLRSISALGATDAPNILYIFTDDHTYRMVSCYPRAYEFAHTPNIDRLAEQGVRFDQAYIGAKCVPSRATAQTGRLQFAVESDYEGNDIPGSIHWFPTLRQNGYYTGMIGKWHYRQKGAEAYQHGTSWDWSVIWKHQDPNALGDQYYNGQYVSINGGPQQPLNGYSTDRYADFTEQFIQERADDPAQKPWFYWLCFAGVHGPYTPAARHLGTLDGEPEPPIPQDIHGPRFGKPIHFQDSKWNMGSDGKPYYQNKTLEFWTKQQMEAVLSIDDAVGRIVQKLEDTGQLENTIIVFTADQGYVWGQHGLKGKIDPYETAIRSPFIVWNPARFPAGKVCKAPINGPDVIRTFHAWANAEPQQFMPGRDITLLIENPESEAVLNEWSETPTLMTYVDNRYEPLEMRTRLANEDWAACMYETDTPWYFMILVKNFKYTRYANPDRFEELYDLDNDPEELINLAIKPQYKSKVLEMRAACIQSIKDNGGAVFADFLPEPTTAQWWPANLVAFENAHALHGSGVAQDDSEVLKTQNGWGNDDSRLAYLRFPLSGPGEINGKSVDSLLSVTLDLWMLQTEGDVANDLQVFALVDSAQNAPSDLTETSWTSSTGARPLLGTNLPQGNADPASSSLVTSLFGSHTFPATGDDNELGLVQIPLSVAELRTLIDKDTNGEITLIVRSTSQGASVDFASLANSNGVQAPPALTVAARLDPPTGLDATALDGRVLLDWDDHAAPNWSSYRVYRSTLSGTYGDPIVAGLTASGFTDSSAVNGTTYYYVVTAVDAGGSESNESVQVVATPEEGNVPEGAVLFGSNNQGLAGFTQSPGDSTEFWLMQPESVRYRNQNTGTRNGSMLREFPINRSNGNEYTVEGVVLLSDGYADDNNRVGIYLFGDASTLPNQLETGALCLLINLDTGMLRLMEGIDKSLVAEADTGRSMDNSFFGKSVRLTAEIRFLGSNIEITGTFTDEFDQSTSLNAIVPAATYTGDYFGFATRSRSRNYGLSGNPQSAPFVMDYQSFYLVWDNEPLTPYEQWARDMGIGQNAPVMGDYDGDGLSNLCEYALGGNPKDARDQGMRPATSLSGGAISFIYPQRVDADGLTYTVQTSIDLKPDSWTATRYTPSHTDVTGGTHDMVTVDVDTNEEKLFIRLKIHYQTDGVP